MTEASTTVTREGIAATYETIRPHVRHTPLIDVASADFGLPSFPLRLKLEFMQHSGSFKLRGAFANLLTREVPEAGVVAASGGNHGAAVAFAANRLARKAAIFVPAISSPAKIELIRRCGAELHVGGDRYAEALAASERHATSSGALPIHAFDQVETMLGQGTVGLEIERDAPEVDTVLVSVGGGGLIGGIAGWYEGRSKVVAVEPEGAPTLRDALAAGRPVDAPAGSIAADSLAPKRIGKLVFPIAREYVSPEVVLVTDADIRAAQRALWSTLRIVVEPGGVTAFAALLSGAYRPRLDERVAVVLSGANTIAVDFDR
jgi:threonine dehydratase